jgi:hypothetical protein
VKGDPTACRLSRLSGFVWSKALFKNAVASRMKAAGAQVETQTVDAGTTGA